MGNVAPPRSRRESSGPLRCAMRYCAGPCWTSCISRYSNTPSTHDIQQSPARYAPGAPRRGPSRLFPAASFPTAPSNPPAEHPGHSHESNSILVWLFLVLAPLLLAWPLPLVGGSHLLANPDKEAASHVWGLWAAWRQWQPLVIRTDLLAWPNGMKLVLVDPGNLLAYGLAGWAGPAAGYAAVLWAGLLVAGLAGLRLARRLGGSPLLGALAAMACPALLASASEGTTEDFAVGWVLLQLSLLLDFVEGGRLRHGILAALSLAMAWYCGPYNGLWASGIDLALGLWWIFQARRAGVRPLLRALAVGAAALLLVAPLAWATSTQRDPGLPGSAQRAGLPQVMEAPGEFRGGLWYGADILDPWLPVQITGGQGATSHTVYLGAVTLLLAMAAVWKDRGSRRESSGPLRNASHHCAGPCWTSCISTYFNTPSTPDIQQSPARYAPGAPGDDRLPAAASFPTAPRRWPWLAGAMLFTLLSLGPHLYLGGKVLTWNGSPLLAPAGVLVLKLGFLGRLTRWYRAGAVAHLLLAPLVSTWKGKRLAPLIALLLLADLVLLAPLSWPLQHAPLPDAAPFRAAQGQGGAVLEVPAVSTAAPAPGGWRDQGLLLQTIHGHPITGTILGQPPPAQAREASLLARRLARGQHISASQRKKLLEAEFRWLAIYPGLLPPPRDGWKGVEALLGPPLGSSDDVILFSLDALAGQ